MSRSRWALLGVGALFIMFVSHVLLAQKIIIRSTSDPDGPAAVTVTITSPTSSTTYNAGTSSSITVSGTASSTHGISVCTWTNTLGGSGTASGTLTWSVTSVALTVGDNVVTVRCHESAGGTSTDVITITRTSGGGTNCNASTRAEFNTCNTNAATDGTATITITSSFSVTTPIVIAKGLTVTGSTCTLDGNDRATTCPIKLTNNSSGEVFDISLAANLTTRISSLEVIDGTGATTPAFKVTGTNTDSRRFRGDHLVCTDLPISCINTNTVLGVMDHGSITGIVSAFVGYTKGSSWDTTQGANEFGDGAHADADDFGTENFFFFEDMNITWTGMANHITATDAQAGGRYVMRYSTITRGVLDGHGLEAGRERSTRAIEIYNNTFVGCDCGGNILYVRGAIGVVHDNTVSGYFNVQDAMVLLYFRTAYSNTWGGADGTNGWDANVASGPFESGTVTSGNSGNTVPDTSKGWSQNQWSTYAIKRTTNIGALSGNSFAMIISNTTSEVITYDSAIQGGNLAFTSGDSYQIWKVDHGMDQPGRTGGEDLGGLGNPPSVPGGWSQTTSPWYEWNNTREAGADVDFHNNGNYLSIRSGTHFIADTTKPGYTPYTYPHPLVD